MQRFSLVSLALAAACTSSGSTTIDTGSTRDLGRASDLTPGAEGRPSFDRPTPDAVPRVDVATAVFCPGGKPFFGGDLSGVYQGTATVPAGKFNKGGTHPATLSLSSVCGTVRGVLEIEQSSNPMTGHVSYKAKGQITSAGTLDKLVLSDRYCGDIACMPHLTASAGMEIFSSDIIIAKGVLSSAKVSTLPGVSYPDLELPFTALSLKRNFPSQTKQDAPGTGVWEAKLLTTTQVFAEPPMSGDNQLTLDSNQIMTWKIATYQNALEDKQLFPSSSFNATSRRVGIQQTGVGGGSYNFAAVLDENWLIGVVRSGGSGKPLTPDVPTELTNDDALHGIWIGQRKGTD